MTQDRINILSHNKFKFAFIVIILCLASVYIYAVMTWKSQSEKLSEKIIREAAAYQLNKDSNELSKNDFSEIAELWLDNEKLSDITFLKKFTNLKNLYLVSANIMKPSTLPNWLKILEKLRLYKKPVKTFMDINVLEKLPNLETLTLIGPVSDLNSITKLKNLKELNLQNMTLTDIEPVKELKGLKKLG